MSDAEQNLEMENEQDYKSLYEKAIEDLDKVVAKKEELYKETKKAKAAKEEAALEAQRIAEEQAKKNGEFEKLWKVASKEKEELMQQLQNIKHNNRQEKINLASMKIASELADGSDAELLSEFIKRNLDNVASDDGSIEADVIKAVTSEFKSNEKFKSLLRGSKASGGSAPGNSKINSSSSSEMKKSEFKTLSVPKQREFILGGGQIIND